MSSKGRSIVCAAWRYLLAGVCAALAATVMGCVDKRVNHANYERIQIGMPMEEVEQILGQPESRHHDDYYYEGEYGKIKIECKKDRVDQKGWKDKH